MTTRRVVLLIAAIGLVLRLVVGLRSLDYMDRLFIPDDAYYSLSIARSMAFGHGVTSDGVVSTSGFQPLLVFMTVPFFWVTSNPDAPLRMVLLLLGACDVLSIVVLARLGERWGGPVASMVVAALWALSPLAIANAYGGLETSLMILVCGVLLNVWMTARERGTDEWWAAAGVCCGLALLARIDTSFLVATLGVLELVGGSRRGVLLAAAVAAIVVAPYWTWATLTFGHPIPESGFAVMNSILQIHRDASDLGFTKQLAWSTGLLVGGPSLDWPDLRNALYHHADWTLEVFGVVGTAIVVGTVWAGRLGTRAGKDMTAFYAFAVFAAMIFCFYTFRLPALWFFRRYLAPSEAYVGVALALVAQHLWEERKERPVTAATVGALLVVLLGVGTSQILTFATLKPTLSVDWGLNGAKGYRNCAQDVLQLLPAGAVVGAFQSGALGYYAGDRFQVVNLDGVVDRFAQAHLMSGTVADYAYERGVTHLADWRLNLETFDRRSEQAEKQPLDMDVIGLARRQGSDRFLVVQITWPPS